MSLCLVFHMPATCVWSGQQSSPLAFFGNCCKQWFAFAGTWSLFFICSWHQYGTGTLRGLSLESGCNEDNHCRTSYSLKYEKCVPLLCRKAREDGPRNYWKSAICLLSFNLTHVNLPCAMDTICGCDFREGMVHLVYANTALKENDWQFFPGTECSRQAGSWLLTSLDTKDLYFRLAVKVMEAAIISRSRQIGSGNVVAEQVSQSSAVSNARWLTWRKKDSSLLDGQWFL